MEKFDQHYQKPSTEISHQNGDVVAVGVRKGERGSIHEAMIEGRRHFHAINHYNIVVEHMSVIRNEGNGLCAYHALIEGTRRSSSSSQFIDRYSAIDEEHKYSRGVFPGLPEDALWTLPVAVTSLPLKKP